MFEKMKELYESGLSLTEVSLSLVVTISSIRTCFKKNDYRIRTRSAAIKLYGKQNKNIVDITGKKFGKLTVISLFEKRNRKAWWVCKCDCGNSKVIVGANLKSGNTKSCRCATLRNGESRTRIYKIWCGMRYRCLFPKSTSWDGYGGRGISICQEWRDSYEAFRDWALENGYNEFLDIDRRDNDGNYEPSNCRFITSTENSRNTRTTKLDWDKVNRIRELKKTTNMSNKEIGDMFGVCASNIHAVAINRSWRE